MNYLFKAGVAAYTFLSIFVTSSNAQPTAPTDPETNNSPTVELVKTNSARLSLKIDEGVDICKFYENLSTIRGYLLAMKADTYHRQVTVPLIGTTIDIITSPKKFANPMTTLQKACGNNIDGPMILVPSGRGLALWVDSDSNYDGTLSVLINQDDVDAACGQVALEGIGYTEPKHSIRTAISQGLELMISDAEHNLYKANTAPQEK